MLLRLSLYMILRLIRSFRNIAPLYSYISEIFTKPCQPIDCFQKASHF